MPFPAPFEERMRRQLPTESAAFFAALQGEPSISLRLNPQKIQDFTQLEWENMTPIPWQLGGFYLSERPSFTYNPLFHAGTYYVQEPASMLISQFLEPENYQTALDLCAAPGGKSTLLVSALSAESVLVANEVIRSRAAVLAENITRWGYPNCIVTNNDPKEIGKLSDIFDLMLIDAPCSGEGMFRKDKESQKEWSEDNVALCAARQQRIVASVLPALRKGGHIIYSTCTYSEAENEEAIRWILANFEEIEIYPKNLDESFGAVGVEINGIENAAYRCYPHRLKGEGFFVCRLRKKGQFVEEEDEETIFGTFSDRKNKKKQSNNHKSNFEISQIDNYIQDFEAENVAIFDDNVFYYLPQVKNMLPKLVGLNFLKKGLLVGKVQGKDFSPSHELALSTLLADNFLKIEWAKEDALQYLQKNDMDVLQEIPPTKGKNWVLSCYKGVPLGWMKVAGNRFKNHFPINWRIRN
jgi:NOL1/NOP2/sun family putative RNA methylase